ANPLALLAEEAGGAATDGTRRILDLVAREPHERAPLVLGAREEVARLGRDQAAGIAPQASPPLFGTRGLFRAG
ncbi:MAG: class 1 fructose-bisphosphatase, partial [Acetobacteraceae bacterium]|nr:class 1 fructose-bisphosphatase [Acetobacteraceae bacterium]